MLTWKLIQLLCIFGQFTHCESFVHICIVSCTYKKVNFYCMYAMLKIITCSVQTKLFFNLFFLKKVLFFIVTLWGFFMTKGMKWIKLFKIGSSHLHLLYYQEVYMVVTNSQTLRLSHRLNGNWFIKSGSSAWFILHFPVILLLSFDGKLMIKRLKNLQGRIEVYLTPIPDFFF